MLWLEHGRKDMLLLLSTMDAMVDCWPARRCADDQTHRWIEDVSAILGILIERQAMHFDLEVHDLSRRTCTPRVSGPESSGPLDSERPSSEARGADAGQGRPTGGLQNSVDERLGDLRAEHAALRSLTISARNTVKTTGLRHPLDAKTQVVELLEHLRDREQAQARRLSTLADGALAVSRSW